MSQTFPPIRATGASEYRDAGTSTFPSVHTSDLIPVAEPPAKKKAAPKKAAAKKAAPKKAAAKKKA